LNGIDFRSTTSISGEARSASRSGSNCRRQPLLQPAERGGNGVGVADCGVRFRATEAAGLMACCTLAEEWRVRSPLFNREVNERTPLLETDARAIRQSAASRKGIPFATR
jgi:hypothetical protein